MNAKRLTPILDVSKKSSGALFAAAASVAVGCATSNGSGDPPFSRTDSAGIAVVVSQRPVDGDRPRYVVDSVPMVTIGGEEPNYLLTDSVSARRMSDGRILVFNTGNFPPQGFNPGPFDLRLYDSTGTWIKTIGRMGQGPGEFTYFLRPLRVGMNDSIYVASQARISVFDSSGRYVRMVQRPPTNPSGGLADGRLFAWTYRLERNRPDGLWRDSINIEIHGADDSTVKRIARGLGLEHSFIDGRITGRIGFLRRTTLHSFRNDVLVADNAFFGYDVYDASGKLARRVRRLHEPRVVTEHDRRAWLAQAAYIQVVPEAKRDSAIRAVLRFPSPDRAPAFDYVVIAENGEVWVREYQFPSDRSKPGVFSVFAESGEWLATVRLPPRFLPTWIGADRMIGVQRREDDVPQVSSYRLTRR